MWAHMLVTRERRGGADGRRNSKGETHSCEGTYGTWAWWAGWVKRQPTGRVGPAQGELGWLGQTQEIIQMEI
jgi:hypothetical protein